MVSSVFVLDGWRGLHTKGARLKFTHGPIGLGCFSNKNSEVGIHAPSCHDRRVENERV